MVNTLTSQSWQWHYQRMEQFQCERRQIHSQSCRYKFSMLTYSRTHRNADRPTHTPWHAIQRSDLHTQTRFQVAWKSSCLLAHTSSYRLVPATHFAALTCPAQSRSRRRPCILERRPAISGNGTTRTPTLAHTPEQDTCEPSPLQ